jgi:hypothetical protein
MRVPGSVAQRTKPPKTPVHGAVSGAIIELPPMPMLAESGPSVSACTARPGTADEVLHAAAKKVAARAPARAWRAGLVGRAPRFASPVTCALTVAA